MEGGHIAEIRDKRDRRQSALDAAVAVDRAFAIRRARGTVTYGGGVERSCSRASWGTTCASTSSAVRPPKRPRPGLPVHGEASIALYDLERPATRMIVMHALLPLARLQVERRLELARSGRADPRECRESVWHRPAGRLDPARDARPAVPRERRHEFRASATRSKVLRDARSAAADYLEPGAEFDWPHAPRPGGGTPTCGSSRDAGVSSAYTAHLMDPRPDHAFFVAFSPGVAAGLRLRLAARRLPVAGHLGRERQPAQPPWNGQTLTRGMEFGVSPFPETRREMIERGRLFDVPAFRWIPAADPCQRRILVCLPGRRGHPRNTRMAGVGSLSPEAQRT